MRKLLIAVLCCLPLTTFAQWSFVVSGSGGMSDFKAQYKDIAEFRSGPGFGGDASIRYSIPLSNFHVSLGAGYLHYNSENAAEPPVNPELDPDYINNAHAYLDESLSSLYLPLTVSFYYSDRELSPLFEAGSMLNVVLGTGDFSEVGGYSAKSTMFSFMVGVGVRYKLYKDNALEVKFRYTRSTNMLDNLSNSQWSYPSLNVGYSIKL